ncbi:unnamed protein product [Rotaria magnacalcarata]|uniref:Metallo-beta-lactamase domain-containing protein n=2 Tax=Rotaria magnacalcarata TaxID=392030 RepID=A0A816LF86_9BILA|nr:unnamed protein product [Rotaria magnacalcarata]CAF1585441.1 unnamed protein product [Rotaria magnacalcarata]CAF1931925.1 unnamed protein product [Rotaria magnacalcarata]CAF2251700.1 unnamed protein product [Rotaria magnacalcarata]CAF3947301.1 unnamed protein product [Rotaria magnacalcarata]
MIPFYILFVTLLNSVRSSSAITIGSVTVTQIRDATAPNQNSNAYVVTSSKVREGFLVDTGVTNSTTSKLISVYQEQVLSTTKPPKFVFVTHGHPDHLGGIALIQQVYPTTPIYVITQQVAKEAVQWMNFSCTNGFSSAAQCAVNYSKVLRVLTSPRTQLAFNDRYAQINAFSVIVKGESSYAGLLGVTVASKFYWLFTGDAISILSHLFISNFFDNQILPASDDALCAWAGNMQASVCELQLSRREPKIFPGHGPISDVSSYEKDVARNVAWLRSIRNLTFNSCNKTYISDEMLRIFPEFGQTNFASIGALNMHVPADANSVGCNCTNDSPTICPVYHAPPTCMHLDINDTDTTLACSMRSTVWWPKGILKWILN